MTTIFDSPALKGVSEYYPPDWNGRVPSRIRMNRTVNGEGGSRLRAVCGLEYDAYVNRHGALCAITIDGLLGLKPAEFTVVRWHDEEELTRDSLLSLGWRRTGWTDADDWWFHDTLPIDEEKRMRALSFEQAVAWQKEHIFPSWKQGV